MLYELIATIAAGFAAAGLVLLLNRLLAGKLPRWSVPVAAGAAMLTVTIANEYTWYPRTLSNLPSGFSVVLTTESRQPYRPWTYLKPLVTRFLAVDTASARRNSAVPAHTLVSLYAFARWKPPEQQALMVDCAAGRHALVPNASALTDPAALATLAWTAARPEDRIIAAIC